MANINEQIVEGKDLMLFIGGKSVAFATSHSLSISAETAETSSKDTGGMWVSKAIRKISWTMNTENLYALEGSGNNYDTLFEAMINKTALTAVFATKSSNDNDVPNGGWTAKSKLGYTGQVIVTSLELNAPNGENATFTATFEGVGELKKADGSTSNSGSSDSGSNSGNDSGNDSGNGQIFIGTSVNDEAMGSVTGGGTYDYGTSVTLEAIPADDCVFQEWGDGNTENPRTVIANVHGATYSAIFILDPLG